MMATPLEPRHRWTEEEDQKLLQNIESINDDPISWKGIAARTGLEKKNDKSCWERWHNHLRPGVNKENFSQEEDDTIIGFHWVYEKSWAFIAKHHLEGRTANAIKNRWNSHLKKRFANMSDHDRKLLYVELQLLTDDETSDHSVRGDVLEALMAEFASLIHNVDPNASSSS